MPERPPSRRIGERIVRPREQVEERIRSLILGGELQSGDPLPPEMELAEQFGVSRATVREALRTLVSERLIAKVPGARGGNFVQRTDHMSLGSAVSESVHSLLALGTIRILEVAEVRQYLEIPSVRLAAEHHTDEDVTRLRDIVARQRTISVGDPEVPKLDEEFHITIAEASQNRVLASFVAALHHETEPVRHLDLSPEVGRTTVRQHRDIVDAIEARDADAAETAIVAHLTYLRHHLAGDTAAVSPAFSGAAEG